jgi:DNA-binding Xre family transcriptional regulator
MKWNLRLAAANRNIWKASDLQRMLAERGLVISAGKMSNLWSGQPVMIRLDDLDVICAVLGCEPGELLVPEPEKVTPAQDDRDRDARAVNDQSAVRALRPRAPRGRSLPPQ